MNEVQKLLAAKHGTPPMFRAAVLKAHADGFVNAKEAIAAIKSYNAEWKKAGETP